MILFYDRDTRKVDTIWYEVLDEEVLRNSPNWVEFKGEIEQKEGHYTHILVDEEGQVSFEFEKEAGSKEDVLEARIDELEMLILLGGDVL